MASRCNQDIIESYFSQIRGLGRFYDHPLPITVSQRIKHLILSRNAGKLITSSSCLTEKEIETLSADILADCSEDQVSDLSLSEEMKPGTSNSCGQVEGEYSDDDDEELTSAVDGLIRHFQEENEERNIQDSGVSEKPELLEMIAGYIAYRMRKKYPERGNV